MVSILQGSLLFQEMETERLVLFFLIGSEQYVFIGAVDENIENVAGTSAIKGQDEVISSESPETSVVTVDPIQAIENQSTSTFDSFSDEPSGWEISETTCDYWASHGLPKKKYDFGNSKKTYGNKEGKVIRRLRLRKESMFQRKLPNGQVVNRDWMIYSESRGCVFCSPCLLLNNKRNKVQKKISQIREIQL